MARKAKDEAGTTGLDTGEEKPRGLSISPNELKKVLKEASKLKANASEAQGEHGAYIKAACEKHYLDRKALGLTRYMFDADEQRRGSIMRQCIQQWAMLGFFAQIDAFDDLLPILRDVVETFSKVTPLKPPAPASATVQ